MANLSPFLYYYRTLSPSLSGYRFFGVYLLTWNNKYSLNLAHHNTPPLTPAIMLVGTEPIQFTVMGGGGGASADDTIKLLDNVVNYSTSTFLGRCARPRLGTNRRCR